VIFVNFSRNLSLYEMSDFFHYLKNTIIPDTKRISEPTIDSFNILQYVLFHSTKENLHPHIQNALYRSPFTLSLNLSEHLKVTTLLGARCHHLILTGRWIPSSKDRDRKAERKLPYPLIYSFYRTPAQEGIGRN